MGPAGRRPAGGFFLFQRGSPVTLPREELFRCEHGSLWLDAGTLVVTSFDGRAVSTVGRPPLGVWVGTQPGAAVQVLSCAFRAFREFAQRAVALDLPRPARCLVMGLSWGPVQVGNVAQNLAGALGIELARAVEHIGHAISDGLVQRVEPPDGSPAVLELTPKGRALLNGAAAPEAVLQPADDTNAAELAAHAQAGTALAQRVLSTIPPGWRAVLGLFIPGGPGYSVQLASTVPRERLEGALGALTASLKHPGATTVTFDLEPPKAPEPSPN